MTSTIPGQTTRDIVYLFCGPLSLLFFFHGAIFVVNAACNNLRQPFQATLVNWGRHTIGTVPLVMAGAAWMGALGRALGQARAAWCLPPSPSGRRGA